ncbi:MAG TPA: hypothetical protein VIM14_08740, partial [Polyangia bacterium]
SFVTYLVQQYGMPRFKELFLAVPDEADNADFEAEFARFYPLSMDQAWRNALNLGAFGSWPIGCLGDWDCFTTGSPLGVGEEVTVDCGTGIHRTMTVGEGQGGVVLLKGGGSLVAWKRCWEDPSPYLVLQEGIDPSAVHYVVMDPGAYTLTFGGTTADLQLRGYLQAPLVGDTCETAGEVELDGQLPTQINFPAIGGLSGWIRLTSDIGRSYDFQIPALGTNDDPSFPEAARSALALCDSCDPSASCVAIHSGQPDLNLFIIPGSVLHFQNMDTPAYSFRSPGGAGVWFHPVQVGADR